MSCSKAIGIDQRNREVVLADAFSAGAFRPNLAPLLPGGEAKLVTDNVRIWGVAYVSAVNSGVLSIKDVLVFICEHFGEVFVFKRFLVVVQW